MKDCLPKHVQEEKNAPGNGVDDSGESTISSDDDDFAEKMMCKTRQTLQKFLILL